MDQFRILYLTLLLLLLSFEQSFILGAYSYRIVPEAGGNFFPSPSSSYSSAATSISSFINAPGNGCTWFPIEFDKSSSSKKNTVELFKLDCNIRKLNIDFWNYTFSPAQLASTRSLHIKCHSQLFFESTLNSTSQIFFQLTNLHSIQIEYCKIRSFPISTWSKFNQLKSLEIHTYNGQWIGGNYGLDMNPKAFDGLQSLEKLDLSWNNIWSLSESRLFCPMKNTLQHLNLSYNRLSEIWDENGNNNPNNLKFLLPQQNSLLSSELSSFSSSSSSSSCEFNVIQTIDLSHNTIRRVGRNSFIRMKSITFLRLDFNYIDEIEDTTFTSLSSLKVLKLDSNRLVALPSIAFKNCLLLQELYLQNNSLSVLSPTLFNNLQKLKVIDLSRNKLTSQWIKENIFMGLIQLIELRLSFNQLNYIDSYLFSSLNNLQILQLDNNRIETIDPTAFSSLNNLLTLDLSRNLLKFIEAKYFGGGNKLRQLYLDYNLIQTIEDQDTFKNCTQLSDLGLAGNLLTKVPISFQNIETRLYSLKTLDIGENKITGLTPDSFKALQALYGLRLAGNQLNTLPPAFCEPLKSLRVLNLAQNHIRMVSSSSFIGCNELRALRLDSNELEQLPSSLPPQLLWLNVSENHIKRADYHTLPNTIEWLDLSYNSLQSLGNEANQQHQVEDDHGNEQQQQYRSSSPYHLRVLDASFNNLTRLDSSTIPPSLETLRVNHNRLKSVAPNTFATAIRLRRVELMGNELEDLPMSALRLPPLIKQLPEFYLGGGSILQCSCSMEWLTRINQLSTTILGRQQQQQQQQYVLPRIVDQESILCKPLYSRVNEMVPLIHAKPSHFLCPYKSVCFALCHCCGFNCDCENQCPDGCTCFHDSEWTTNIVECSNLNLQQIPERIPMDATELYLDGNTNLSSSLTSHVFIGKKNLRILHLNHSRIEIIRNKTFNGLKSLQVLHLNHNLLNSLSGYEFNDISTTLRELYLHNNLLRYISSGTFNLLQQLEVLRIDGNLLTEFNVWELNGNPMLSTVLLASNPWTCDCEFVVNFHSFIIERNQIFSDYTLAKCQMTSTTRTGEDNGEEEDVKEEYDEDEDELNEQQLQSIIIEKKNKKASSSSSSSAVTAMSLNSICSNTINHENNDESANEDVQRSNFNHITRRGEPPLLIHQLQDEQSPTQLIVAKSPSSSSSNENEEEDTLPAWTWWLICFIGISLLVLTLGLIYRHEIYYWCLTNLLNRETQHHLRKKRTCLRFCCLPNGSSCSGEKVGPGCGGVGVGNSSRTIISSPCIGSSNSTTSSSFEDNEKLFDAYFLYSKSDEEMLCQKLTPELEQGHSSHNNSSNHTLLLQPHLEENNKPYYRLCLHYRDLCLNLENNIEMMLTACDSSKRIVVILSRTFLHSELVNYEFRNTLQHIISKYTKKLIFILLPPLNEYNFPQLYPDFKSNAFKNSTLDWMDKNFWCKLKSLLPAPTGNNNGNRSIFRTSKRLQFQNNNSQQQVDLPYSNPYHQLFQLQNTSSPTNATAATSPSDYYRNIIPYQTSTLANDNNNRNSLRFPKHHQHQTTNLQLPPLYWQQQSQQQAQATVPSPNRRLQMPGPASSVNVIYPTSSQPSPQYFTFADNFKHHHQQTHELQQQPFMFASSTGKRRSTNSNNNKCMKSTSSAASSPYKPLLVRDDNHQQNASNVSGDSCCSTRILTKSGANSSSSSSSSSTSTDSSNSSDDSHHNQPNQLLYNSEVIPSSSATEEHIYSTLDSPNSLLSTTSTYPELPHQSPSLSKLQQQYRGNDLNRVIEQQRTTATNSINNGQNRTMYFV